MMRDAMVVLFNSLNSFGNEKEKQGTVVNVFSTSHRTLQQCFMRTIIIPILLHLAENYKQGRLDGRNMESGRLASRMLENLNDDDLYLPFI